MKFIAIIVVVCFGQLLKSQTYNSKNNFTGDWVDHAAWNNLWPNPSTVVLGTNLNIYGYISVNGNLDISGTACTLSVYDTLVIHGNLTLGNNINLIVAYNGLLIIKGNLSVVNNTDIFTNGYIVITGDFINTSSIYGGSCWTTGNPAHVFIGGSVPDIPDDDEIRYPVLDCDGTWLDRYPHSACGYGNETDLTEDPIYDFFTSTCTVNISTHSNSPLCEGEKLELTATGGVMYNWSGPSGFRSTLQNPVIDNAGSEASGIYKVQIDAIGCSKTDSVNVEINLLPQVIVNVSTPACEGKSIFLSASGGMEYQWTGPAGFQSNDQNPVIENPTIAHSGEYRVKSLSAEGCADSASISVSVKQYPEAYAGEDITIEDDDQARMNANSSGYETGEWTIVSGSGVFSDKASPVSSLSELPEGESVFKWTTANGTCISSDEVLVKVIPLFIPNVITPNSDGKNDNLVIIGIGENSELIIFDRMGITVFSSGNYGNNWNGLDNSGTELPADTYYYILKTRNGHIRKGSILIKRR